MKSAFFFSLDLPSREFIELSVGKAKDQRVGFLLQLDIKSGILSESKEVARSNYDAMVEVARECSGSAVLLLSQGSGVWSLGVNTSQAKRILWFVRTRSIMICCR